MPGCALLLENEPMKDTIVIFFPEGVQEARECVRNVVLVFFIVLPVVSAHIVHTLALLW